MGVWMGTRCYRLAALALLGFIAWQIVSYFWLQQGVDQNPQALVLPKQPVGMRKLVEVEVYYEALCPDSMNFVVDQLAPAMQRLQDAVHLVLVPYGKATTQYHERQGIPQPGDPPLVSFSCQHGPNECWANKVHACGIQQAANQSVLVQFVTCLMRHFRRPRDSAEQCARDSGLQWKTLAACAEDEAIDTDMERYGKMTQSQQPRITFIPTITIDGDQSDQAGMFDHFLRLVCDTYEKRNGAKAEGC